MMMHTIAKIFFVVLAFHFGSCQPQLDNRQIVYLATTGDDNNSGGSTDPLQNFESAKGKLVELAQQSDTPDTLILQFQAGEYFIDRTMSIDSSFLRQLNKPLIIQSDGGEVIFTGGKELPTADFTPVKDEAILQRLYQEVREQVYQFDLAAAGVDQVKGISPQGNGIPDSAAYIELFVDGKTMTLARYPNQGFVNVQEVIDEGIPWRGPDGEYLNPDGKERGFTFTYGDNQPERWQKADDIWMMGYFYKDWASNNVKVKKIDTDKKSITTIHPNYKYPREGQRYYYYNLLEEIDQPGEWYLDQTSMLLYFYPPEGWQNKRIEISLANYPLLVAENVKNLQLEDFTFQLTRSNAIEIDQAENVVVDKCLVQKTGQAGIILKNALNSAISNCQVNTIGTTAIDLDGGNRKTLSPGNNEVVNNEIHNFGRLIRAYRPGVSLSGVGNRVAHNKIYDAPHSAILWSGNEHIMEFNEIFDVVYETNDAGAIYSGRDPSMQGNYIQYNYFHHIKGPEGHGTAAIYFDDGHNGNFVIGNVFYKTGSTGRAQFGAVFIHGGRYNEIINNIFVDCPQAYGEAPWGEEGYDLRIAMHGWSERIYENVDIRKPPYSEKYPWMKDVETDRRPNIFNKNLVYRCEAVKGKKGEPVMENNWEVNEKKDFIEIQGDQLTINSQDLLTEKIQGFEKIPFEKMGLKNQSTAIQ